MSTKEPKGSLLELWGKNKLQIITLSLFMLVFLAIIAYLIGLGIYTALNTQMDNTSFQNHSTIWAKLSNGNWSIRDTFAGFISIIAIGIIIIFMSRLSASKTDKDSNWYKHPLGLPSGSIRAIIALLFVIAVLFGSADYAKNSAIAGILGTILGFYFGDRKSSESNDEAPKPGNGTRNINKTDLNKNPIPTEMKIKIEGNQVKLYGAGEPRCLGDVVRIFSKNLSELKKDYAYSISLEKEEDK